MLVSLLQKEEIDFKLVGKKKEEEPAFCAPKLKVVEYGVPLAKLKLYHTYFINDDVNVIVGSNPRHVFAEAGLSFPDARFNDAKRCVDLMRECGSKEFDAMIHHLGKQEDKELAVFMVSLCQRYKAWRESSKLKQEYLKMQQMWNLLLMSNRAYLSKRKSLYVPSLFLRYMRTSHQFPRLLATVAFETNYNEWYLLFLVKCRSFKRVKNYKKALSYVPVLDRLKKDKYATILYETVIAFCAFAKQYMHHDYSMSVGYYCDSRKWRQEQLETDDMEDFTQWTVGELITAWTNFCYQRNRQLYRGYKPVHRFHLFRATGKALFELFLRKKVTATAVPALNNAGSEKGVVLFFWKRGKNNK